LALLQCIYTDKPKLDPDTIFTAGAVAKKCSSLLCVALLLFLFPAPLPSFLLSPTIHPSFPLASSADQVEAFRESVSSFTKAGVTVSTACVLFEKSPELASAFIEANADRIFASEGSFSRVLQALSFLVFISRRFSPFIQACFLSLLSACWKSSKTTNWTFKRFLPLLFSFFFSVSQCDFSILSLLLSLLHHLSFPSSSSSFSSSSSSPSGECIQGLHSLGQTTV
jgi:hypothetical protein